MTEIIFDHDIARGSAFVCAAIQDVIAYENEYEYENE